MHFGVVLIFVAITGSSAYQIEQDIVLHPSQSAAVGPFTLQYEQLMQSVQPTHEAFVARVNVSRGGQHLTTLYPEKRLYFVQNQPTTEVALRTSLLEDLYVILAEFEPSRIATFKVFVNPLVAWIWIGGLVVVIGTVVAVWSERHAPRTERRQMAVPTATVAAQKDGT